MKKNIIFAVVLMVACLQQLCAQDSVAVSATVAKRFEEAFDGAENIYWVALPKKVMQVQFHYKGAGWLAYFDSDGNIITCGRRIKSVDELPITVQDGLRRVKARIERKGEAYQVFNMYEMTEREATRYFVSFQSDVHRTSFYISPNGTAALAIKQPRTFTAQTPKDVIARKH